MLKAAILVLGKTKSKELAKISLSSSTIKTHIDELAKDIEFQVLEKTQHRFSTFSVMKQCCLVVSIFGLWSLFWIFFNWKRNVVGRRRNIAEDVFKVVVTFFDNNGMKWERFVGVYTDSAPEMVGPRSGYVVRINRESPNAVGSHCAIHREFLASSTLSAAMKDKLATIVRAINFANASAVNTRLFARTWIPVMRLPFHTSVQWLSKSIALAHIECMKWEMNWSYFLKLVRNKIFFCPSH